MILSRLSPLGLVFGLSLFAVGCVDGGKTDDSTADDSSATDDSSSTDDSSTDDSGTTGEASFSGTVTMTSVLDGATICNVTTSLQSSRDIVYSGECADCDFGFEIDASITADSSTADCPYYYQLTWLPNSYRTETFMGHWEMYYGYYGNYYDVFASGYGIDYYYYYYPGPYWTFWTSYDGGGNGTFSNNGGALSWTFDYVGTDAQDNYYYYCSYIYDYQAGSIAAADYSGESTLPCDGSAVDVWTFDGDGGTVTVTADTVASNSAFDIFMYINDGSECTIATADDSVDCSFPPPQYSCPSVQFTSASETYTVVVGSYGSCADSTTGAYALKIEMDNNAGLDLAYDDVSPSTDVPFELHSVGSGTITQ